MTFFQVDLDELSAVVADMLACQRDLIDLAGDVAAETARLHGSWDGVALAAHASSYSRWSDEFAAMTTALAGLRAVGETARANYSAAVVANLAMWESVR